MTKKLALGGKTKKKLTEQNFRENFLSQLFFRNFFRFWAEELGNLAENYWQCCQNHFQCIQKNLFTATFLKQVFKRFNFFVFWLKFPWQQRKIILRVDKTAKNVSSSKLKRNLFQKKTSYCSIFLRFRVKFFLFLAKNYRHGCENCNLRTFRRFWSFIFEKLHNVSTFFWAWDEKSRAFSRKDNSRVFTTGYRASRGLSWGKMISLSKSFVLFGVTFGDWAISLSFCLFLISWIKTTIYVRGEKKLGKLTLKNCYFINFGLWAQKTWTFSKTVGHDSENCSLRDRRKNFKNFSEATIFVWKFCLFEWKGRISCEKFHSVLPKANFRCPVEHFEKKLVKLNFSVCGFKILCDFFTLKEELPLGVKTTY